MSKIIEIKEEISPRGKGYKIYIDGNQIPRDDAYLGLGPNFWVHIYDFTLCDRLGSLTLSELPANIDRLTLNIAYVSIGDNINQSLIIDRNREGGLDISFEFEFDIDEWNHPWSIGEYGRQLIINTSKNPIDGRCFSFIDNDTVLNGFNIKFPVEDLTYTIDLLVDKRVDAIQKFFNEFEILLKSNIHSDAVITYFNFPEETRVACEQYLLYFVQFLKDLGVEANAQLQNESGRVLFAVTPAEGVEALDKIRQALDVYLKLPKHTGLNPVLDFTAEIQVQRLMANIQHLNGQLMLAQAIIQAKDATIESKEITIRQLMQGDVFVQYREDKEPEKSDEDKEDILGGAISLTPYEGKGFEVNIPMIFRVLKQYFARKES